jgi:hypothetical protein
MPEGKPLSELLSEDDLRRRICREMCRYDGVDPDESLNLDPPYDKFCNWELRVADVSAVLRAMKAIAS